MTNNHHNRIKSRKLVLAKVRTKTCDRSELSDALEYFSRLSDRDEEIERLNLAIVQEIQKQLSEQEA